MPEVKGKKFDYSVEGIKQAETLAKKTGEQIDYNVPGGQTNAMNRNMTFEGLYDGKQVPKELAALEPKSVQAIVDTLLPVMEEEV
jgi:hypothetical protein